MNMIRTNICIGKYSNIFEYPNIRHTLICGLGPSVMYQSVEMSIMFSATYVKTASWVPSVAKIFQLPFINQRHVAYSVKYENLNLKIVLLALHTVTAYPKW